MDDFGSKKISAITTKDNFSSQKLIEKLRLKFQKFVTIPNDPEELMYYETEQYRFYFNLTAKATKKIQQFLKISDFYSFEPFAVKLEILFKSYFKICAA